MASRPPKQSSPINIGGGQSVFAPQGKPQYQAHVYQSNVLPPEVLSNLEKLVPGTAELMIQTAIGESTFRRDQEAKMNAANIETQKRHIEIMAAQQKSVARSDWIGQVAGFLVCVSCVVAGTILGLYNAPWEEVTALCAIPTAAVVWAFRMNATKPPENRKK